MQISFFLAAKNWSPGNAELEGTQMEKHNVHL